ncbi:hypothetical protein BRADI_4g39560v3 [Brachypodium distachyon]|uniref:Protein kinase domain-containing protein n=1 Tax=Brachypodium distachyon TaxID=15368 RepID=I1ITD9_BRADI|nr:hypothetical protein BRADI_4g39560v3 [Brachypodium distachyon]
MEMPNCSKSIKDHSGLIGLSVASGPCFLLLVLCVILIIKRVIISLEELEKATNNFDETQKLGEGGQEVDEGGQVPVYKGILSGLHVVAIKKSNIVVEKEIDEFINEVAMLSQINHRNIVKLFGCCLESEVPFLAYEFISNRTLGDYLHKEPPRLIPWTERLRIATEIVRALACLHSAISVRIIHRDLKSPNILLDEAMTAKVSGFGTSRYKHVDQRTIITAVQGTRGYFDPTYYYTGRLTEKSDVYSFGVILVELLTRKVPTTYESAEGDGLVVQFVKLFEEGNLVEILDPQVVKEGGGTTEQVAALAASCVKLRGEQRPTMRQVEIAHSKASKHPRCMFQMI